MYLVPHTKGDLDNHANQLNPNNPRYAGHQERIAAAEASREAAALHQKAQAAYQYANQMEAGRFFLYFYYEIFFFNNIVISCYASTSCCRSIKSTGYTLCTTSKYGLEHS